MTKERTVKLSKKQKEQVLEVLNNIKELGDIEQFLEDCEIITFNEKPGIYCSALAINIKKYIEYIGIEVNKKLYKKISLSIHCS